jgi:hypothetical protein
VVLPSRTVYGYFSLRETRIKTPGTKESLRQAPWPFYFWLAGQDPPVQAMEIKHPMGSLVQFYRTADYKVDNKHLVSELAISEYGVSLLLDPLT